MKLTDEQETICKVFRERRNGGVNCYRCPMELSVRGICLKIVSEEEAKANWDWNGSPYPALEKGGVQDG